jgi:zinc protease
VKTFLRFVYNALLPVLFSSALLAQTAPATYKPPSYKDLKFPPLRQVKIPDIPVYQLPNGIKLYLLENHELPLVSGFALIRTGGLFDPPGKTGLGQITGTIMRTGGTKAKTGDQIDVQVENLAAGVESGVGLTSGRVSFNCLRENTDEVMALFRDILTAPEFRQEKLDLLKGQLRGSIARRNDDAPGIAGREFNNIIYGRNTPYGREMEYADLDRIQREDLVAFYKRYYFPANTVIAIQGDFSAADMKAKVEKLLGDWNSKQPPVPLFPQVEGKPAPGVYLATKNDVTQTFFEVGHLGGIFRDKNYPALEVMSDILGGGFSSRLFRRVRTELGYAYNIGASWGANFDHPGIFRISGSTQSANTVDAIKAAEEELARIRTSEVTDQELQTAKDTALNSFVFNFDSPSKTLGRIVAYEYYGYPKDFIFEFQKSIEKVTKADILRVAKEYIKPENLTIVAVGKPQEFKKPLATLGKVIPIDLTIQEPKKAAAKSSAASLSKGREILSRAQQAVGGAGKLAAVKDVTELADVDVQTAQGAMKAKQVNESMLPGRFRQTQELPFGKVIAYSDGSTGWMQTPQGQMPMSDEIVKQVQMEIFRQFFSLLLSDRNTDRTINAVGENRVEIADNAGHSVTVEIDPASALPVKQTYQVSGNPVQEAFSDWREVDGIKLPFRIIIEQGGQKFADVTVRSWKLNTGLKAEDLSKKP